MTDSESDYSNYLKDLRSTKSTLSKGTTHGQTEELRQAKELATLRSKERAEEEKLLALKIQAAEAEKSVIAEKELSDQAAHERQLDLLKTEAELREKAAEADYHREYMLLIGKKNHSKQE